MSDPRHLDLWRARLTFSGSITTPDVVDVYIPQKKQTFRSNVIWRHGRKVGVAFAQAANVSLADNNVEPGGLVGRIERLETELATMKKVLKRLKADAGPDSDVA